VCVFSDSGCVRYGFRVRYVGQHCGSVYVMGRKPLSEGDPSVPYTVRVPRSVLLKARDRAVVDGKSLGDMLRRALSSYAEKAGRS
jgi:hypothetical protein